MMIVAVANKYLMSTFLWSYICSTGFFVSFPRTNGERKISLFSLSWWPEKNITKKIVHTLNVATKAVEPVLIKSSTHAAVGQNYKNRVINGLKFLRVTKNLKIKKNIDRAIKSAKKLKR